MTKRWTHGTLQILLMVAACSDYGVAQNYVLQPYAIPIVRTSVPIPHPFVGGFFNPAHQFADIDGDSDFDLFQLDMADGWFSFFHNIGSAQTPSFVRTSPGFTMPPLRAWFRMADINANGLVDMLTAGDSTNSVSIYRNTGTAQVPQFSLLTAALRDSAARVVFAQSQCIPALADIDGDGDQDFFSLNPGEGTINFYQNIGTPQNLLLAFRTARWQNIQICPGCFAAPRLHGQGSMYFADVDGDNDFDFFYGDLFDQGLFFYQNVGTATSPLLDSVSGYFPVNDPIITDGFNQPTLVDIDADADLDLFVSTLAPSAHIDNFWFFRNNGTSTNYQFARESKNYLPSFDLGAQSAPGCGDIDGDNDLDLLVGNLHGVIGLLRNIGSSSVPAFVYEDSLFLNGWPTRFTYVPRLVDIDADGDLDLVVGHFAGNAEFYRNVGTPAIPNFQRELAIFDSLNAGFYVCVELADIDGDSDFDMFVGDGTGRLRYYQNIGTAQVFRFQHVTSAYQGIQVVANAKPAFGDIDGDGDLDLVVGGSEGEIALYRNTGTPTNPVFVREGDRFGNTDRLFEVVPLLLDIDADTDLDLLVGSYRGGLQFYRNTGPASVAGGRTELPPTLHLHHNYPNPFNATTTIRFDLAEAGRIHLRVFDVLGRLVADLDDSYRMAGSHSIVWDAAGVSTGVYLCRLAFVADEGYDVALASTKMILAK